MENEFKVKTTKYKYQNSAPIKKKSIYFKAKECFTSTARSPLHEVSKLVKLIESESRIAVFRGKATGSGRFIINGNSLNYARKMISRALLYNNVSKVSNLYYTLKRLLRR